MILKTMIRKTQKHGMGEKETQLLLKMTELDCRKICWSEEKYNWATADYPKNTLFLDPQRFRFVCHLGTPWSFRRSEIR